MGATLSKIDRTVYALATFPKEIITTEDLHRLFPMWDATAIRNRIVAARRKGFLKPLNSKSKGGLQRYKITNKRKMGPAKRRVEDNTKPKAKTKPKVQKRAVPRETNVAELVDAIRTIIDYIKERF